MNKPNILFVVWDACRSDYALSFAPNLRDLIEENFFTPLATPSSTWSVPSHASMFSGVLPTQHKSFELGDSVDPTPLLTELKQGGYYTAGVSENGFLSPKYNFDSSFDNFLFNGHKSYQKRDGVNPIKVKQRLSENESYTKTAVDLINDFTSDNQSVVSTIENLSLGVLSSLSHKTRLLSDINSPFVKSNPQYGLNHTLTTRFICENIGRGDKGANFVFANYMNTHRPYTPTDESMQDIGIDYSFQEIHHINNDYSDPWKFMTRSEIDHEKLKSVRDLYAAEVRSADIELGKIVGYLKESGKYQNTLIIVTSDHGENLGERSLSSFRKMGHESSTSDYLLTTPLLIAHPEIDQKWVSERIPLKNIFNLIKNINEIPLTSESMESILHSNMVMSEYPGVGQENKFFELHPSVPRELGEKRTSIDHSVCYMSNSKLMYTSAEKSEYQSYTECSEDCNPPEVMINSCERSLRSVDKIRSETETSADLDNLKSLGYI